MTEDFEASDLTSSHNKSKVNDNSHETVRNVQLKPRIFLPVQSFYFIKYSTRWSSNSWHVSCGKAKDVADKFLFMSHKVRYFSPCSAFSSLFFFCILNHS